MGEASATAAVERIGDAQQRQAAVGVPRQVADHVLRRGPDGVFVLRHAAGRGVETEQFLKKKPYT